MKTKKFNWDKKKTNPKFKVPQQCPICGKSTINYGYEVTSDGEVTCYKCGGIYKVNK